MKEFEESVTQDFRALSLKEWMHNNGYRVAFGIHMKKKNGDVTLTVVKGIDDVCKVRESFARSDIDAGHFVGSMLHKAYCTLVDPDSQRK